MAHSVSINPATSGTPISIASEDLSGSVEMPVCKLHTGALDVDGGPATITNGLPVALAALSGAGFTPYASVSAAPAVQKAVKVSPGTIGGGYVTAAGTAAWLQIWNHLTADVNPGTTAPDIEIYCPANTTTPLPCPAAGINMSVGITAMTTTGAKGATGSGAGVEFGLYYI